MALLRHWPRWRRNKAIAPYDAPAVSLARGQLVDDERLDEDRIFVRELGAESGLVDQLAEQVEVGIRRDHDIDASAGSQALARLVEQGRDVAIGRARLPAAIGQIFRLARMLGR